MINHKIAMWSGPRNISTAMMRAFENRPDTEVWDEPLYGHYLHKTGIDHPGAVEVIADQGIDWQAITQKCSADAPNHSPVFYQKHMTMHLLPDMDKAWLNSLTNCFLIRRPELVVASYGAVRPDLTLDDIGFVQQADLFEYVAQNTQALPIIIDSEEFLQAPERMLRKICNRLKINYLPEMLQWPAGKRVSDGVWAKYWYDSVWQSTGFMPYQEKLVSLPTPMQNIADQAEPYYQRLYEYRLKSD